MISTAATFIFTILTFYTYCQLIRQHDKNFPENILWIQSAWQIFYLSGTLLIIYNVNLLTNEVNNSRDVVNVRWKNLI